MDRHELHKRLQKARDERERRGREINLRLGRAVGAYNDARDAARVRLQELSRNIEGIRAEGQDWGLQSDREIEHLEGQLRASAPRVLFDLGQAIQHRWSEIQSADAGSAGRAIEAEALHEATAWIRCAATDGSVDDAAILARWRDLQKLVPNLRHPIVEVAA